MQKNVRQQYHSMAASSPSSFHKQRYWQVTLRMCDKTKAQRTAEHHRAPELPGFILRTAQLSECHKKSFSFGKYRLAVTLHI